MTINPDFEIVNVANEYMAVPVGDTTKSFNGIVGLNDAAVFLLKQLELAGSMTKEDLAKTLMKEYLIDSITARKDVDDFVDKLKSIGMIVE